jgi:hypothetical protein
MKRPAKPSLLILPTILVIALAGSLTRLPFHPTALLQESSAVVQRIAGLIKSDMLDRTKVLETLRACSSLGRKIAPLATSRR